MIYYIKVYLRYNTPQGVEKCFHCDIGRLRIFLEILTCFASQSFFPHGVSHLKTLYIATSLTTFLKLQHWPYGFTLSFPHARYFDLTLDVTYLKKKLKESKDHILVIKKLFPIFFYHFTSLLVIFPYSNAWKLLKY
jgi:hypothetical protein